MKENLIRMASDVKSKDDCSLGDEDFTSDKKYEAIDSTELCAMTKELFENEADFYTDKNVTECHLPELIVCYNDSAFNNVVKDICVDDGNHPDKRIPIENCKDDVDVLNSKSSSQEDYDECGDIKKEGINGLKSPSVKYSSGDDDINGKSSSESDSDHEVCCPCDPADQSPMNEENNNATEKSTEVTLRNELCPQTSLKSLLDFSDNTAEQSFQIRHEEAITKDPVQIIVTEESNKIGLADDSKFKPDVGPEDINQQPIKLPNNNRILEDNSAGNKFQREEGESSFSVPNSGVITYSGPMIYSGNVSLRSDSSTTSTRSFAFPVLPNEWNSSPIRMAKAKKGFFHRHGRWRRGLLCCKF